MPSSPIPAYIKEIAATHSSPPFTEHSFRGALKDLLQELLPDAKVTNEPGRVVDCGAPDYVLSRNKIPLGYVEAKNVDKSLDDKMHQEQLQRYLQSLDNLIFTNYLEFRFYRDNKTEPVVEVAIAELCGEAIKPLPQNFAKFADLVKTFGVYQSQPITTADDLAKRMADKARFLADVIGKSLSEEDKTAENRTLDAQLQAFKKQLIFDINVEKFAGIYAQTIAYGMFVARLHDSKPATFSRRKASQLIPQSNPFLKKFFGYIADYELDERIRWIVDDLADIFRATDVGELMKNFGKATQRTDPFIHFYETFLGKYDRDLRIKCGVYYTPEPVVKFIVRAVDDILKKEFDLFDGLTNAEKTTITVNGQPKEVHKVQILDPATGTGTFLAEVVNQVYAGFANRKGEWPGYVKEELIPRLNGFEFQMAPYAMAHLKLEMILRDTEPTVKLDSGRLRVFLTDALEEHHPDTETLFAVWLSDESKEADEIKRDTPVMVVLGNPPYNIDSGNLSKAQRKMVEVYKFVDGDRIKERGALQFEKNINNDYVKFIRCGQQYVDLNGEGILAYINSNSFLDGPTFRGMRWHLLRSFDKIYILDLHGDSNKKEVSPDGSPDTNVFDIQQGVSINLFIKTGKKEKGALGEVFHAELYGSRESKYEFLRSHGLAEIQFGKIKIQSPKYSFVPTNYAAQGEYEQGFSLPELFIKYGAGVITAHDKFVIDFDKETLIKRFNLFKSSDGNPEELHQNFDVKKKKGWNILDGWRNLKGCADVSGFIHPITVRPFDVRHIFYERKLVWGRSFPTMRHVLNAENIGLIFPRRSMEKGTPVFLAKNIIDKRGAHSWAETVGYLAPLYIYPETKQRNLGGEASRKPNLNAGIIKTIADKLGMRFTPEKAEDANTFAPLDLLDYIYATLHSLTYREKFREFLKIDFPRVPFPRDKTQFHALTKLGAELRALHLMESEKLDTLLTTYPETGDNTVTRHILKDDYEITDPAKGFGKTWINNTQYFGNIPKTAWEFCIGGYQPAQKYLKDRKGRTLTWNEINHYQKIIVALVETEKVMEKIDKIT